MSVPNFQQIFVTVGLPNSDRQPLLRKVGVQVNLEYQTVTQAAKIVRKSVADNPRLHDFAIGTKIRPAQLYFEVYPAHYSDEVLACSANAPCNQVERSIDA